MNIRRQKMIHFPKTELISGLLKIFFFNVRKPQTLIPTQANFSGNYFITFQQRDGDGGGRKSLDVTAFNEKHMIKTKRLKNVLHILCVNILPQLKRLTVHFSEHFLYLIIIFTSPVGAFFCFLKLSGRGKRLSQNTGILHWGAYFKSAAYKPNSKHVWISHEK